jgi:hypothetical protein
MGGVRKRGNVPAAFFSSGHAEYRFRARGYVVSFIAVICIRVIGADSWYS